jgi:nucleoside-diphosphate-sugar epimerase
MSRIILTGTTGFVGSALARSLQPGNHIVELNRRAKQLSSDSFTWNFHDPLPVDLPAQSDIVIHSAADTSDSLSECFAVNVGATSALLEYARAAGATTFVYLSTGSVYGVSQCPQKEGQPLCPRGPYACTKAAGEFVVQAYQNCFRTLILRLYFPFGPAQRRERLIPRLIDRISRQDAIPVQSSTGPTINPLYVDDLTMWVRLLLESEAKGTFNLAGAEPVTIRQLSEKIGKLVEEAPRFEDLEGEPADAVGETTEIERVTNYSPRWNLDAALVKLAIRRAATVATEAK